MTTLNELKSKGGLVPDAPIRKTITFDSTDHATGATEQVEANIFVRQLSVGEYEALFFAQDDKRSRTAKIISEAIRLGESGKERISFEDAYKLTPSLAGAMVEAFNEVNIAKKSSRPVKDSSAN
jgi:hypothetical protein